MNNSSEAERGLNQSARRAELFAAGEEHFRAADFVTAEQVFQNLHAALPHDANALRMLALCRLRLGAAAEALQLLSRARALDGNNPLLELDYGSALHAVGRHIEAAEQFRLCQRLLPEDPAPFLNLAAALLALGAVPQALDAARRARRRADAMPQTHYMVGLALLAADRLPEAYEAFSQALRRDRTMADGWVNLGVIRYRQNDIEAAKRGMYQALAVQPGHRGAAANLGAFLRLTGEGEAGEALLRGFLATDPEAAEVRLNLAVALLQEERPAEALELLDARPTPDEPRLARHWHLQRCLALLLLRRPEAARAELAAVGDGSADLDILIRWRRALLALASGDATAAREHAAGMEQRLQSGAPHVPEHRIMAHFDLAKFWSTQQEPDRAFPHWKTAHRLLAPFQPFSRDQHRRFADANIACFSRERLHQGTRARNQDPTPVFIVGMPRSGTTLAEQIIGAHGSAFAAGERTALGSAFAALGGDDAELAIRRIAALDADALDRAAANYLAELRALAPGALRVVDKMPGNFNYLGLIGLMLPGARVIHCVRDPRDVGFSIFTFRFYGSHPYAHDLADLGWYISEHYRIMAHWRAALPNRILTVALRDWIDDFDQTLRTVLDFLDLPYDPACERFYEQDTRVRTVSRSQVRRPVNRAGLGRWRPYAAHLQPLIAALSEGGALPVE